MTPWLLVMLTQIPATAGWHRLNGTRLEDVCAQNTGFPQLGGSCSGILAWSSGAFDTQRNRHLVFGGGHGDYYGNEVYALELDPVRMRRLNDPSLPTSSGCQASIGDGGQPNSRHTYDALEYLPGADLLFTYGGSLACGPGNFGTDTWTMNVGALAWSRRGLTGGPRAGPGAAAAVRPADNRLYMHDGIDFFVFSTATGNWTQLNTAGSDSLGYHLAATVDSKRDVFLLGGYDSVLSRGALWAVALDGGTQWEARELTTSGATEILAEANLGFEYVAALDRVVAYREGDSVYLLDPSSRVWEKRTFPNGPPVAPQGSGGATSMFGRFRYSPASQLFSVIVHAGADAFALRLGPPTDGGSGTGGGSGTAGGAGGGSGAGGAGGGTSGLAGGAAGAAGSGAGGSTVSPGACGCSASGLELAGLAGCCLGGRALRRRRPRCV